LARSLDEFKRAQEILLSGGIIAFPTDTVMGLGVNGLSQKAVSDLFGLKKRPSDKPLYMLAYSVSQILEYVDLVPDYAYKLINKYFPGSLTLIFRSSSKVFTMPDKKGSTLGVRIPNHPGLIEFLSFIKLPFLNTSANVSGLPPILLESDVKRAFENIVHYVGFEYNKEMSMIPSTVVDCTGKEPVVLREGNIVI
jgi:L-threonylcarbamoyladenylate synthase